LRAEGFSCSLDVLYRGLEISTLQFLIKKILFFSAAFFINFWSHQNPGSGTGSGSGDEMTKNAWIQINKTEIFA
jgi:hypothetical protein